MKPGFDWQTEEEGDWEAVVAQTDTAVSRRRPTWWHVVLLLVVLAAGGFALNKQITQRVEAATEETKNDVKAAYQFVTRVGLDGDEALFKTVLSGRDAVWLEVQQLLVADDLFLNRPAFGLQLVDGASPAVVQEIILAPGFDTAEVTAVYPYQARTPQDRPETVRLLQTAVFRYGANRWLLAPPLEPFWGEWQSKDGRLLTLIYPERDAALAKRLLDDLDEILAQMCTTLDGLTCPASFRVRVRLENDVAMLADNGKRLHFLESGNRLTLPTPTLVGLPVDDAGYNALLRGYGTQIVEAAINNLVAYDCCQHAPFQQALVDWQLAQLDLQAWPPIEIDYARLVDSWLGSSALEVLWSNRPLSSADLFQMHLYTLVDYLLASGDVETAVVEMQHALNDRLSYTTWMGSVLGGTGRRIAMETEWMVSVMNHANLTMTSPPPDAYPDASVQLVCLPTSQGESSVLQYDMVEQSWHNVFANTFEEGRVGWVDTMTLPNMYVVYGYDQVSNSGISPANLQISVWRDGEEIAVFTPDMTDRSYLFINGVDPTGRYLQRVDFLDGGETTYWLVDLTQCENGRCPTKPLDGYLFWSPTGNHTLIMSRQNTFAANNGNPSFSYLQLQLADAVGQNGQNLGLGSMPVWLTDEQFAYVRPLHPEDGVESTQELLLANIDGEEQVILTNDTLLAALPETERPNQLLLYLHDAAVYNGQIKLALTARSSLIYRLDATQWYYLVTLQPDGTLVSTQTIAAENISDNVVSLSPDGQWLAYSQLVSPTTGQRTITLAHTDSGEQTQIVADSDVIAWSPDGRWLAYNRNHSLILNLLGTDFRQVVEHNLDNCWQIGWVER
ncbi:MAG: hypothetical protein Kow0080_06980 [Candidatus Promineifilaceae bacterium]